MSKISKLQDYDMNDIATLLDLEKDKTNVRTISSYQNSNYLTKQLVTGSLVLLLHAPLASVPVLNRDTVSTSNVIQCVDEFVSPIDYGINELTQFYSNTQSSIEALDIIYLNKVQNFADNQIELDKDFKLALDELTSEIAKDKPSKPRF